MRGIAVGMLACLALLVFGCGSSDESVSKKAGRKLGEGATDFVTGVGTGVDKQMLVEVEVTPAVTGQGLAKTIAKSTGLDAKKKGICVYFIAKNECSLTFLARALNKDGLEIGRSKVSETFGKDDAKYVTFPFDEEMDSALVKKYQIDLLNEPQP